MRARIVKRIAIVVTGIVLTAIGLSVWARTILSTDVVRETVERQLTLALGQPVAIAGISAGILPRVTMTLRDVRIGAAATIVAKEIAFGTSVRAVLSRRLEHATLHVRGAHVTLPLPRFAFGSTEDGRAAPIRIVSVDEVVFDDVTVESGGHSLHGIVELTPHGRGATVRRAVLAADATTFELSGEITDFGEPSGDLSLQARTIDAATLLPFASAFAKGSGRRDSKPSSGSSSASAAAPDTAAASAGISLGVTAGRMTFGTLEFGQVAASARLTSTELQIKTLRMDFSDGELTATGGLALSGGHGFHLQAVATDVDAAALTKTLGSAGTISGRLSGGLDIASADASLEGAHGSGHLKITNGVVARLGLLRTVVIATSMRTGSSQALADRSTDEPFSQLSATVAIANAVAHTTDLRFESKDLLLTAAGAIGVTGRYVDLAGDLQLSDDLSRQAGRDLVRYTQRDGRVTVPVTISGTASDLLVQIGVVNVLKRAITNRATEEAKKAVAKELQQLLGR